MVHLEIDQNGKLVIVKKMCFLALLTKIWDLENFTFASENDQKRPISEAQEKVFKKNVAWDVANNGYVNCESYFLCI